jgi:2-polyprenyl-3-methyl-5-hydroxy-6-metoxy-1,4-benzoquinol methylase
MFFTRRATQAEYFDLPDRPATELAEAYAALGCVNRFFVFNEPFQRLFPKFFGRDHCRSLSFLDLGAGDGSLGAVLTRWAAKQNWDWRFTNLDLSLPALRLGGNGRNVAGSVLALPFRDASFDVVIASQMTHHLGDQEVPVHLREAWRVARQAVFVSDLHRNIALYTVLWLFLRARGCPAHFRYDGLLSVKRGFRVRELRNFAAQAGIDAARVWMYAGARIILQARKPLTSGL